MDNDYETIDGVLFLDLDSIFDPNGEYIDDYEKYQNIKSIKITLFRSQKHPIKIGNFFLYNCTNLTTIDLSPLSNVISIGNGFLSWCTNLTTLDLSFLSNVTSIGSHFLYNCKNLTTIELSFLSNVTSIDSHFLYNCKNLTTIELSPLSNVTSIGHCFLDNCKNLTTIDLSPLSNVTSVGHCFLYTCSNLTTIDLSPLSNVTSVGHCFLSSCSKLTTIDLSPLSNVTSVDNFFLSWCENLTTIDLSPLTNVTSIGDYLLSGCSNLTTAIVDNPTEYLKKRLEQLKNITIINKSDSCIFTTYNDDIEKITTDKDFVVNLLKYLQIIFNKSIPFKYLIKKINKYNSKYRKLPTLEYLKNVRNEQDIVSMEELKDIPKKRIILIEEMNGTYNGFDVVNLRKLLFVDKKEKYMNPLTTNKISDDDMKKILNVDIRCINYFII